MTCQGKRAAGATRRAFPAPAPTRMLLHGAQPHFRQV